MNRDEREGKEKNVAGRIKQATGTLTGNRDLEEEGADERAEGNVQEGLGRGRRKLGEALEDLGDEIKR
jgi:uncharacterized protein YjbJ (UPF0337 family)